MHSRCECLGVLHAAAILSPVSSNMYYLQMRGPATAMLRLPAFILWQFIVQEHNHRRSALSAHSRSIRG